MIVCVHPLDGILAFLGAVGIVLPIICAILFFMMKAFEPEEYKAFMDENDTKLYQLDYFLMGVLGGTLLLVIVIILAFVNQALPPVCY